MRLALTPLATGLALIAALAAGCSAASAHHAPAAAHKPASAATHLAIPAQTPVADKHAARRDRRHHHRAMALAPPAPPPILNPMPRWQVSLVADHLAVWGDLGEVIFAASALGEHELARALTPP